MSIPLVQRPPPRSGRFSFTDETGYGYSYDNRHKPVVCDHTYTLSKGSHKIQLEIHTLCVGHACMAGSLPG